jgi:peroxiredoxin (alkyl hydroperoxide reductase subunit C)
VSVVAPGTPAPDFTLQTEDGGRLALADLKGSTTVLVFFPFAFSPVCTDQFSVYQEVLDEFEARGAQLYGVSCDATWSLRAFREKLGVSIPMLSDFEPKGAMAKAFGAYFEPGGMTTRALVIVGPDRVVRWSWIGEHPGVLPGANLIFDGLAAA